MKVSAYMAITADGFVADAPTIAQWQTQSQASQTDYGFAAFYETVDRIIVGRQTFSRNLTANLWPYGDKRIVVLSRGYVDVPATLARLVETGRQTPQEILTHMWREQTAHVYVDGALTVRSFLASGLISELTLTRLPLLAGQGQTLYGPVDDAAVAQQRLDHQHTELYPDGVVQTRYQIIQPTV